MGKPMLEIQDECFEKIRNLGLENHTLAQLVEEIERLMEQVDSIAHDTAKEVAEKCAALMDNGGYAFITANAGDVIRDTFGLPKAS